MSAQPGLKPFPKAYLAPFLLGYLAFWLIPLVEGFGLSLQSDTRFKQSEFVGAQHYLNLLDDGRFFTALQNTGLYAFGTIAVILPLSLLLASLLRGALGRLRGIYAFLLLLPGLTPPSVLAFLFLMVFSGPRGYLNAGLELFDLGPFGWFQDPVFIRLSLVLQAVWRWTGFATLFLAAGMDSIPRSLYETARSEGAGVWQRFVHVTLPLLRNVIIFVCAFLLLDAFVLFEGAYVLLGSSGGPGDAGLLLVSYAYFTAFTLGRFGSAAAMSFSLIPLVLLMLGVLFLVFGRRRGKEA